MSQKPFSRFSRGATPATTAIIVVLALILIGGLYYYSTNRTNTTSTTDGTNTSTQTTGTTADSANKAPTASKTVKPVNTPTPSYASVRTLLSKPNAMVCELRANGSSVTETLSIAKGKLRADSRAGNVQTSYIYTTSGSYMWSNAQDNKLIQGPVADAATSAILAMPAASFACKDQLVNDNSFIPPAH